MFDNQEDEAETKAGRTVRNFKFKRYDYSS